MLVRNKNIVLKEEQKNELIVQHNHLIEARYHLTLQEKRLMCWLASQVKLTDKDFKEHELSIKEFAEMVNVKGDHLYKALDTITHKLMQKIITIKSIDETEFVKVALLSGVKYLKNKGIIKLSFHPYLSPYMLQVKERFTQIGLGDVLELKSVYSIRIYELLKQYETIGNREILLDELKEFCGIKENQYQKFSHVKERILDVAQREISNKTDLVIDYEEIKTSRKITSINFTIKHNTEYGLTEFEKMQKEKEALIRKELRSKNALIERIMEYGFSRQTARKFLEIDEEQTIENAVKSVEIYRLKNDVKNTKALIRKAIKEQWHPEKFMDRKKKAA